MRTLVTSDLFSFARAIKASGIRDELVNYLRGVNSDSDREEVGMQVVFMIIGALSEKKAEQAIYDALTPVFEVDVKNMALPELFANLKKMSEENDLGNFFDSVFGIAGRK